MVVAPSILLYIMPAELSSASINQEKSARASEARKGGKEIFTEEPILAVRPPSHPTRPQHLRTTIKYYNDGDRHDVVVGPPPISRRPVSARGPIVPNNAIIESSYAPRGSSLLLLASLVVVVVVDDDDARWRRRRRRRRGPPSSVSSALLSVRDAPAIVVVIVVVVVVVVFVVVLVVVVVAR